jgi:hypothetical protein
MFLCPLLNRGLVHDQLLGLSAAAALLGQAWVLTIASPQKRRLPFFTEKAVYLCSILNR